ncbi:MAG: salt stress protein, Slr1339 family [Microcystaceae cyanobacterium]
MMSEMDELLAQLKAEYEQKVESTDKPHPPSPSQEQTKLPYQSSSPLDNLLAEVKSELAGEAPPQKQATQSSSSAKQVSSSQSISKSGDSLLKELQAESQEQARLEEERRQQQLAEEKRLQEQRRQRRRQDLAHQAQVWLKKLDPKSEEGIWFAEFSYSYESKLEAAIDYLEALRESQRNFKS